MSDDVQDGNAVDITTYGKQELLEMVIGKHNRLLNEYSSELDGIRKKVDSLNFAISSSRQKMEEMNSRIDILTEKRQLFYHQAEKQMEELKKLSDDPEFLKGSRDVSDEMSKAKTSLPLEGEKKLVDSILDKLSLLDAGGSNTQDAVSSVKARVTDAIASSMELGSVKHPDEDLNKVRMDSEKELNELGPRYNWLENRINSHKEALDYWERRSSGHEDEVKA
ncbi:MAG: hypothetical protein JW705_05790 [Methanosarcinaceae archaeon]|nr:hypothetical protein [Methanosarcinaceae archaeon]